jgi:hypothetical protein
MLTPTFFDIIEILGYINELHHVHYTLDLGTSCDFTLLYLHEHKFIPSSSGEIFLSVYLENVKSSLQFLLNHPERMQYIIDVYGYRDQKAFNEIVGNLIGLHFIDLTAFD